MKGAGLKELGVWLQVLQMVRGYEKQYFRMRSIMECYLFRELGEAY